jgi:hypothetical protein
MLIKVVSDDSESDKPAHSSRSLVGASIHPMAPLEDADAPLATGSPFLSFLEPALLLALLALLTLGGLAGNGHPLHAQFFGLGFVGGGEKPGVRGGHAGSVSELLDVSLDGRCQQGGIAGTLLEYFVMRHNLVFSFLNLDHFSELGRLARFADHERSSMASLSEDKVALRLRFRASG